MSLTLPGNPVDAVDITPTAPVIEYTATLISPLHHGAGSSGNTSLLRTEDIVLPDGRQAAVPYLSGNSMRHLIRAALAWHTAHTLDIEPGSLSKATADLLWSGGAVTSTGAQVDLELSRRVNELYPALSLLGYAAKSDITAGTLRVSALHLACTENAWRAPSTVDCRHPAARYRGEEFGTRHDIAGTAVDRYLDIAGVTTTQMIYDLQVLKPGATLWGSIHLTASATDTHLRVLRAALHLIAPDGTAYFGAKTATGYGQALITGWPADGAGALAWWTEHLTARRDEVLQLIKDVA